MSGYTRFGVLNTTFSQAGALLKNGTGGGAPALVQDAGFPMSNALKNDRQVLWNSGAAAAYPLTITLDVQLDSARTISCVGIHGLRLAAGTSIATIQFYTQVGAYTPAGTWVLQRTVTQGSISDTIWTEAYWGNPAYMRDFGAAFTPIASVVSVRIVFNTVSGPFAMGKVTAFNPLTIGSYVGDPGMELSPQRNEVVYTLPSGSTFLFNLGDNARKFSIQMSNITSTQARSLEALAYMPYPFVLVDNRDFFWDCVISDKQISMKQTAPVPLYMVNLSLVSLP